MQIRAGSLAEAGRPCGDDCSSSERRRRRSFKAGRGCR